MHPALEELLRDRMGFAPETVGHTVIDKIIRRCIADSGAASVEEYVRRVQSDDGEMLNLIDAVVVPETWFFRDSEAFAALSNWALRDWLPRNPAGAMRALCLPCSTGEEPYSVAMTLLNAGFAPSRFRIDGVDISGAHVTKAKAAIYTANSFRKTDPALLKSYFTEAAKGRQLCASIRDMVNFRRGNVLDPEWGLTPEVYDVIFCRNLLIYFGASTQETVFRTLDRMLRPGGLLFVGSAEAYLVRTLGYSPLDHKMSFGYTKPDPRRPKVEASPKKRRHSSTAHKAAIHAGAKSGHISRKSATEPPIVTPSKTNTFDGSGAAAAAKTAPVVDPLVQARELAGAGSLGMAKSLCQEHIEIRGPSAEGFLLLGVIADAQGDSDQAEQFYRKALYIDPTHEETLLHLAVAAERRGDGAAASRFRGRARRSGNTSSMPPGEPESQQQ